MPRRHVKLPLGDHEARCYVSVSMYQQPLDPYRYMVYLMMEDEPMPFTALSVNFPDLPAPKVRWFVYLFCVVLYCLQGGGMTKFGNIVAIMLLVYRQSQDNST